MHDGGADDQLALIILLQSAECNILGIIITPADCYIAPAVNATRKILHIFGKPDIPVLIHNSRGVHPFPSEWRAKSYNIPALPMLLAQRIEDEANSVDAFISEDPYEWFSYMVNMWTRRWTDISILVTGPVTFLVEALRHISDEDKSHIEAIFGWVGLSKYLVTSVTTNMMVALNGTRTGIPYLLKNYSN